MHKKNKPKQYISHAGSIRQRGISLFIIIVFVMLSMLLALWSFRASLFGELVVSNEADYQRAFEAAQALVQDAEFDVQGINADGSICTPNGSKPDQCRPAGSATVWFPVEAKEFGSELVPALMAKADTQNCLKGICLKRTGSQDFWNDSTTLAAMLPVGARYGQFTGATVGSQNSKGGNPILKTTDDNQGGWYWIEVMQYDSQAGNSALITNGSTNIKLNPVANVVFRITAIAKGLKSGTQVVLQTTYVRQKLMD
ncbi:MAG: pilus assembly protein [Burkholderiaceae bacterium]|jgi:type IV pilus assembly protein PilX|nr:pilus assembly protein [Burkholderiaceae bacterium]